MITYCTGSVAAKRRAFKAAAIDDAVYVDNDEVLATFTLDKNLYIIVGDIPYSNMTIEQYVACSRALVSKLPINRRAIKEMLLKSGIKKSPKRRLSKLDRIEFRAAALSCKTDVTTKKIYVNFDSLEFCSNSNRKLKKFLSVWSKSYEVFVSVSDTRFIPKKASVLTYNSEGGEIKRDYTQKRIKMSTLQRRLAKKGMDIKLPKSKLVLMSDSI